jgi:hypothetical protein
MAIQNCHGIHTRVSGRAVVRRLVIPKETGKDWHEPQIVITIHVLGAGHMSKTVEHPSPWIKGHGWPAFGSVWNGAHPGLHTANNERETRW